MAPVFFYPLPLILDIVENIDTKKVFTKLNLRWDYNNIWKKEGNKWKPAFTTPEGLFEPTVIFFGLKEVVKRLAENNLYVKPEKYR